MSGGGSSAPSNQTQTTTPWAHQAPHLSRVYNQAYGQFKDGAQTTYGELGAGQRQDWVDRTTGIDVNDADRLRNMGLDAAATKTAVNTGGFVPFTQYERVAQNRAVDLANQGPDPYLRGAQRELANNRGIDMLEASNPGMAMLQKNTGIDALKKQNPAMGYLDQGARGDYLTADSNPYLAGAIKAAQDPLIERFQADIMPGVTSQFGAAGRFGSGAHQYAVSRATDDLTKNLADSATQAYAQNYGQERQNQLAAQQGLGSLALNQGQALGQLQQGQGAAVGQLALGQGQALAEATQRNAAIAPSLSDSVRQQQLSNLGLLEGVGGAQSAKAAQLGTMQADPWAAAQNAENQRLMQYAQLVQGGSPGSTVNMSGGGGGGGNQTAGALGGAASGAAMGSMIMPGWGTAAGALIGGVGGYFA